jgi:hypothetical protein
MLEAERIKAVLAEPRYVFVDAVYCFDEFEYLSGLAAEFSLIGIEASFSTRLARLKLIEENAVVRIASAFWHEPKAVSRPAPVRYHDTTYECQAIEASQRWGAGCAGNVPPFIKLIYIIKQ